MDGSCNTLSSSPWHDIGMPASHLELFVSWVPLVGGSLGAMMGGILSDRIAKVSSAREAIALYRLFGKGWGGKGSRSTVPAQLLNRTHAWAYRRAPARGSLLREEAACGLRPV